MGLALNMMLLNIPYNVFANSNTLEEIVLNDESIPLDNNLNIENLEAKEPTNDTVELLEDDISNDFVDNKTSNLSTASSITNYAESFAGGDGSEENPYHISNALELARLAYLVNEENLDTTNMYFKLTNDIDLNNFDSNDSSINGNWTPIGTMISDRSFKGVFDGSDYKISNLNINQGYSHGGLFGVIENASIKNLQIENFTLNDMSYGGLLAGYAYGSINIINIKGINNKIINKNISSFGIGGLIGSTNYLRFDSIHYVNIENIELEVDIYAVNRIAYTIGGIIGDLYSSNNINIHNVNLNLNIDGVNTYMGGLIGYSYISDVDKNKNLNIQNISINVAFSDTENSNANTCSTGGMIGYFSSAKNDFVFEIENVKIYFNSEIPQTVQYFSGLIATMYNTILNARNVEIKGTNNTNAYYSAGLIADFNTSSINIDNILVDMDIFAKSYGAGLITEVRSGCGDISINNFNYKGKIVGTDINANHRYSGVIADCYTSKNVKLLNSTVEAIIEFEGMNYSGGLFGSFSSGSALLENNKVNVSISNCKYQTGGLIGFLNVGNDANIEIKQNEVNLNIKSNIYDSSKIGGIIGQIYNSGNINVKDNFVIGDIDAVSNDKGYFSSIINNNGEISVSSIYFVSDIDNKNSINDRDTYLYSELSGNNIKYDNIYYNSDVSNLDDSIAIALTTEQMQGLNAKDNMSFDYSYVWKLNRDYYPTFNQLNTAPKLQGNDIELILNQDYNLLDYITIEDFEDKDLVPEIVTDLDITKIGNYTVTFTVTDPQGLSDTLTLNIKVVMENPIINANDIEIFVNDDFDEKKGITAIDVDGTDITEYIKVIENTVNTKVPGVYKVVYEIESLYKATIQKEIKVTVKEKTIINDDKNNNKNETNKPISNENKNNSSITKPQTGDNFIIYGIVSLSSFISLVCINRKNKKE